MWKILAQGFGDTIQKIRKYPQLIYTIFVAGVILVSFILVATLFINIAKDAQERLINVRVGSIQDGVSAFAADYLESPTRLNEVIQALVVQNPTIQEFSVVKIDENRQMTIISSNDPKRIGETVELNSFLTSLALNDSENSYTIPESNTQERFFNTIRGVQDAEGKVVAVVYTRQTLSEADRQIDTNIRNSIIVLVAALLAVMLLFLRHSRIVDYSELYQKIVEVDRMKDDFISMASHELKTPLTVIRGYAEMLQDDKKLLKEAKERAKKIGLSAERLNDLVNDMLDVSRIEQQRLKFNFASIQPIDIIKEVVEGLEIVAKAKGLELSIINEKCDEVILDKDKFRQVMVNLVSNAVKYTKAGSVVVKLYQEKNWQILRVIDTGIGMSEEERANLFQKFYRIKNADTESVSGTGLGLWITKQIIEQMHGKIEVESIKGVGTHFIVYFPLVKKS
jgi:signal transduction histidine kinase